MRSYERRTGRSIVVRYEDLVLEPAPTLTRLLGYLGVEAGAPVVERMLEAPAGGLPALADHRTAADPRTSIGRWRRELDDELLAACEEAFGPALETFGYRD